MSHDMEVAALGEAATEELNEGSSSEFKNTASAADLEPGWTPDVVLVAASSTGCEWPVLALRHGQKSPAHPAGDDADNHQPFWLRTPGDVVGAALDYQRNEWERHQSIRDPNFAVVTGVSDAADHLALVALDVDGGGGAALADLLAEAGPEAEDWAGRTVRVAHGDPARCHVYGLLDARPDVMLRTMPRVGEHLELRALGGYVALPGSTHPTGGTYEMSGGELIVNDGAQPDHGLYDGVECDDCGSVSARWRVPLPVPVELLMTLAARGAEGVESASPEGAVGSPHNVAGTIGRPGGFRAGLSLDAPTEGAVEPLDPETAGRRLAGMLDRLADPVRTPEGTRDITANNAAFLAGGLLRRVATGPGGLDALTGDLDPETVRAALRDAAMSRGLTEREADKWRSVLDGWCKPDKATADRRDNAPAGGSVADPPLRLCDPPKIVQSEELETVSRAETAPGASEGEARLSGCPLYGIGGHDPLACPDCLEAREAARVVVRERKARSVGLPSGEALYLSGGSAVLDAPADPVPVWGAGSSVLWAEGESLILLGVAGLGKTTLAQQLALGRCGAPGFTELLGLAVAPDERRVLYLAMDRPRQAIRSLSRMVDESMRDLLDDKLRIYAGPPPATLTDHPEKLAEMAAEVDAGTVVVDSLKDAGSVLDDEGGTGWNRARQLALSAGVQMLELHHPRKLPDGQTMPRLEDAYGSTWLTAGAGSVLGLGGRPGDLVVKAHHLKQPAEPWGPADICHDHAHGRSRLVERADLVAYAGAHGPITVAQAAQVMTGSADPSRTDKNRARRKLDQLVATGKLVQLTDNGGRKSPATWGASLRVVR